MSQQRGTIDTCDWYTVQPGDSLWLIAEQAYGDGTKWQWIYGLPQNHKVIGDNPDLIQPGQKLFIPHPNPITRKAYYTVQTGDTLQSISERAYCNAKYWQGIWADNENVLGPVDIHHDGIQLQPGQDLFIAEDPPGGGIDHTT